MIGPESVQRLLIARTAPGELVGVGLCVGYCDAPTVTLETADGKRIHWRADLCELIDVPEDVIVALRKTGDE